MSEVCRWSSPRLRAEQGSLNAMCGKPATHSTMFSWFCPQHAVAADRFHGKRVGKSRRISANVKPARAKDREKLEARVAELEARR